jgi:hypothetical protein
MTPRGIELDVPEATYHAHPALSSTGARRILESPARYKYWTEHQQPGKQAYDVGTAAHALILGTGSGTVEYPEEHITASGAVSTKAATIAWAEEQRANGLTPIAPAQARKVNGMAEAVLAHETAGPLLERDGNSEASVFATDETTGVPMRARFDRLANIGIDLKTTAKLASADGFARTVASYGYDVQQEFYERVYTQATGQERIPFVFIVVETEAPHLVGVHSLDVVWQQMGAAKVQRSLETFAECTATGVWPGYDTDVQLLSPPNWLTYQFEDEYEPLFAEIAIA